MKLWSFVYVSNQEIFTKKEMQPKLMVDLTSSLLHEIHIRTHFISTTRHIFAFSFFFLTIYKIFSA